MCGRARDRRRTADRAWKSWGHAASEVCDRVRDRLAAQISEPALRDEFAALTGELRTVMGSHLDGSDVVGMLAEHAVTAPVLDCFFAVRGSQQPAGPVAGLDRLLAACNRSGGFGDLLAPLDDVYKSVAAAADRCDTADARSDLLKNVHEDFLRAAVPDTVRRLGIVYTPAEIVDFVLRSADVACRRQFNVGLTDDAVEVIDPFAGVGTFCARLLTISGSDGNKLISDSDVRRKYNHEVHAAELVPLACRSAAAHIESAATGRLRSPAGPFTGLTMRDTLLSQPAAGFAAASQTAPSVRVIVMNPPWSAGQKSADDDNPNISYPHIVQRVRDTYSRRHRALTGRGAGKSSANLYVQAIRWASDQLTGRDGEPIRGVVAVVHPNSLCDAETLAGMRATLSDEFAAISVVNLLGDASRAGADHRREGEKVFGSSSRNGVQITVLVADPDTAPNTAAELRYVCVAAGSSRTEKLAWLDTLGDIGSSELAAVAPNDAHHWTEPPDSSFAKLVPVCVHRGAARRRVAPPAVAAHHALGVETKLDTYVYGFDRGKLEDRMRALIDVYETARLQVLRHAASVDTAAAAGNTATVTWTGPLKATLRRGDRLVFNAGRVREVLYRPFVKVWFYDDPLIVASVDTPAAMFADGAAEAIIVLTHRQQPFGVFAARTLPDFNLLGRAGRCIPRQDPSGRRRRDSTETALPLPVDDVAPVDNITGWAVELFAARYGSDVDKDAVWEYLYGVMHAPDWQHRHRAELRRGYPRIPLAADFDTFRAAGRRLLDLHIGYETAAPYPLAVELDNEPVDDIEAAANSDALRMGARLRWATSDTTSATPDTVVINGRCRVVGVPAAAHGYLIAGRSPLQWTIDSLRRKHHKPSGIVDDPARWHAWADNPFELVQHLRAVARVSVESARIVAGLPPSLPSDG